MLLDRCDPGRIGVEGFSNGGVGVKLRRIYKVYRVYAGVEVQALKGIDLDISSGGFYIVMGPSGSGKTTLLNIIGGVEHPTAGQVFVDDELLNEYSEKMLERYRLCIVGYVFQSYNLVPVLNAVENVVLPMAMYGIDRRRRVRRAKWLLKKLGLEKRMYHRPHELSGGEQQRIAIAVALANDPSLILADEPTAELDHENAVKVIEILSSLSRKYGKTVVVSTHDPRIIGEANRVVLLEDGSIRGIHRPGEIIGYRYKAMDLESLKKYIVEKIKEYYDELDKLIDAYREGRVGFRDFDKEYRRIASMITTLEAMMKFIEGG